MHTRASKTMRSLCAAAFGLAMAGPVQAQMQVLEPSVSGAGLEGPCAAPQFTISAMPWPSSQLLANIHAQILRTAFECTVAVTPGDQASTLSAMTSARQPAVIPEVWAERTPEVWNSAVESGSVLSSGPTYSGGPMEGWFVSASARADNPGLEAASALGDYWQVFAQEGAEQAQFFSCPEDWACNLINRNLIAAYELAERFEVVAPVDRADLDQTLAGAVAQARPVVTYYWQPNALIDQLDLVPLDMGAFDENSMLCIALAECVAYGPSAFPPDTIVNALADWVFSDAPLVADYFSRAQMPLSNMNALLAWQIENDASMEEAAQHFVATQEPMWREWVGEVPEG